MSEPTTVHVDITTSIDNATTGYSATFCTQETLTVAANQGPHVIAVRTVRAVAAAHADQIHKHNVQAMTEQ